MTSPFQTGKKLPVFDNVIVEGLWGNNYFHMLVGLQMRINLMDDNKAIPIKITCFDSVIPPLRIYPLDRNTCTLMK